MLTPFDFCLTRQDDEYRLAVVDRASGETLARGALAFAHSFLAGFALKQLDVDSRDPYGRMERLRAFGDNLFRKLMAAEEVARVWQTARETQPFVVLCLRIAREAQELEALPWETLYDAGQQEYVAAGANTTIVRLPLDVAPVTGLAAVPLPVRMLALVSSPLDLPETHRLQMEREQEILLEATNTVAGQGRLRTDFEDEAKLEIIENSLAETPYHVLHYTGHGLAPQNGGGLLLEDMQGKRRPTSVAEVLQTFQRGAKSLRLVVLSGCQTARTDHAGGFQDLARALLRQKIPAVIAAQFSITDRGGLKFADIFYRRVAESWPLEMALHAARRALLLDDDYFLQADALALVLLTGDGACLATTMAPQNAPAVSLPQFDFSFYLPLAQLSHGFYGRRREYRRVRDALLQRNQRAVVIHGLGGIGKTALVSHIATRLRKQFKGVYAFDCSGGTLTPETFLLKLHQFFMGQGVNALQQLLFQQLPPDMLASFLAQILTQWPLLVIFDNFESQLERMEKGFRIADENLRVFLATLVKATATGSHFLFTSRYVFEVDERRLGAIEFVPLEDLSRPEALSLMQKLPELAKSGYGEKIRALEQFGAHPYALVTLDRYCHHQPLSRALADAATLRAELREFLAIEINYQRLAPHSRELLNRLAAFRAPVPHAAAEWVMGEKGLPDEMLQAFMQQIRQHADASEELKALDDDTLKQMLAASLPEMRSADNMDAPLRELVEWGLLTPLAEEGAAQQLTVHALVRDFCREKQAGDGWREQLREAAAFYTNLTKATKRDDKTPAAVWGEMEAFELLLEAEDWEPAAEVLLQATTLLDRWGYGGWLASQYNCVLSNLDEGRQAVLLHNLGIFRQTRGDYAQALEHYQRSLPMLETMGNQTGVASSLQQIGSIHQGWGDYAKALEYYQRSLQILEMIGDQAGVAILLHNLGSIHQLRGDYGKAVEYYQRSWQIRKTLGDQAGVASSLHNLGSIHQLRGDYEKALENYQRSWQIRKTLGDQAGVAASLHQIGIIHQLRGDYGAALEYYQRSLQMEETLGDQAGVASSLHQIGMIHQERGDYGQALEYYQRSLQMAETLGNQAGIASSLHNIGIIHQERGEYGPALEYYQRSLQMLETLGDQAGVAASLHQIGIIHQLRGDYGAALEYYQRSLQMEETLGDQAGVASSLHQIGMIHQERGDYGQALEYYQRSLQMAETLGNQAGIASSLGQMGQLMTETGRYDEALPRLLAALSLFAQLESPDAGIAANALRQLRGKWGAENFDAAWRSETGGAELPEWLAEPGEK